MTIQSSEALSWEYICRLRFMKIFPHLFQLYATCFVSKKHINLREIVRNLLSLDKADGTEPDEILCEAESSTFPLALNIQLLFANDSAKTE